MFQTCCELFCSWNDLIVLWYSARRKLWNENRCKFWKMCLIMIIIKKQICFQGFWKLPSLILCMMNWWAHPCLWLNTPLPFHLYHVNLSPTDLFTCCFHPTAFSGFFLQTVSVCSFYLADSFQQNWWSMTLNIIFVPLSVCGGLDLNSDDLPASETDGWLFPLEHTGGGCKK